MVEMVALSTCPSSAEAIASPVLAADRRSQRRRLGRREGRLVGAVIDDPVRIGNLEERELHLPELRADLDGVRALADGDVLDEIPNVVVFQGGAPLRAAEAGISAGAETRKAAVGGVGGGRVIPADTELLEQIRVRVGARRATSPGA